MKRATITLPNSNEKPRTIPWAGLFHDPDMVPAERIDDELAEHWVDDLDRDRG
jgi:3-deoxy-D-arabino-heptulosonate 7-phosphate (DAHP) synthase